MLFALSTMSPTVSALFFTVAVVLLVLDAVGVTARVGLLPLGLACFVFVFAWQAWAAT